MKDDLVAEELDDELDDGETETETETDGDADAEVDADADDIESGDDTDNVGDPSVEINVEDLIRELEADGFVDRLDREKNARKRLEELMEMRRAKLDLEDFDDYDF